MVPNALSLLVLIPLIGALLCFVLPKNYVKPFAVVWTLIPLVLAGSLFAYFIL